ncbi:hypothetical protein A1O7_07646 [Cladophialophora yegresii CBS 114405]|uniref:Uncharacterized protein n=1 Tax=Cladophialophora yegresii CBS 114405 TaxID=1182544 RepID=W9WFJ2_9EURO|nr:uncharacterized protein A1O7_07646 [Cladophialophora yegresii CBS 114405]EXJ57299.1 hypothetical protein A1O7_07646 [Cladophialophora yegresii CBS 114405]
MSLDHNTTDHEAAAMDVAKEIAQERMSNHVRMNQEDHPNLRYSVHPDEPDHSKPSSQRTLSAKEEREAKDGVPTTEPQRKVSL